MARRELPAGHLAMRWISGSVRRQSTSEPGSAAPGTSEGR